MLVRNGLRPLLSYPQGFLTPRGKGPCPGAVLFFENNFFPWEGKLFSCGPGFAKIDSLKITFKTKSIWAQYLGPEALRITRNQVLQNLYLQGLRPYRCYLCKGQRPLHIGLQGPAQGPIEGPSRVKFTTLQGPRGALQRGVIHLYRGLYRPLQAPTPRPIGLYKGP